MRVTLTVLGTHATCKTNHAKVTERLLLDYKYKSVRYDISLNENKFSKCSHCGFSLGKEYKFMEFSTRWLLQGFWVLIM